MRPSMSIVIVEMDDGHFNAVECSLQSYLCFQWIKREERIQKRNGELAQGNYRLELNTDG